MDPNAMAWEEVDSSTLYSHPLAKSLLSKVYAWMAFSMLVTAGVALWSTHHAELFQWTIDHFVIVCIGSIAVWLIMSFCQGILTAGALAVLLLVFAGLEGLLFGPLLMAYTQDSLGLTFACTAGTFGAMSLYGAFTKRDLSPWRRMLIMLGIGFLICFVFNFFWGNGLFDLIVSAVGVVIFSLFTAYDTQNILRAGLVLEGEERAKGAVIGALALYLDFINLFFLLLRFLGDRR